MVLPAHRLEKTEIGFELESPIYSTKGGEKEQSQKEKEKLAS